MQPQDTERLVGYLWPAISMRPEAALDKERDRVRQFCRGAELVDIQSDEGTPAPEVGPHLRTVLRHAIQGQVDGVVVAIAGGPVVCVYPDDERFAQCLGDLVSHPLIKLALEDTRKRLVRTVRPGSRRKPPVATPDPADDEPIASAPMPPEIPAAAIEEQASDWQPPAASEPWLEPPAAHPPVPPPAPRAAPRAADTPRPPPPPAHWGAEPDGPPVWLIGVLLCALIALAIFVFGR